MLADGVDRQQRLVLESRPRAGQSPESRPGVPVGRAASTRSRASRRRRPGRTASQISSACPRSATRPSTDVAVDHLALREAGPGGLRREPSSGIVERLGWRCGCGCGCGRGSGRGRRRRRGAAGAAGGLGGSAGVGVCRRRRCRAQLARRGRASRRRRGAPRAARGGPPGEPAPVRRAGILRQGGQGRHGAQPDVGGLACSLPAPPRPRAPRWPPGTPPRRQAPPALPSTRASWATPGERLVGNRHRSTRFGGAPARIRKLVYLPIRFSCRTNSLRRVPAASLRSNLRSRTSRVALVVAIEPTGQPGRGSAPVSANRAARAPTGSAPVLHAEAPHRRSARPGTGAYGRAGVKGSPSGSTRLRWSAGRRPFGRRRLGRCPHRHCLECGPRRPVLVGRRERDGVVTRIRVGVTGCRPGIGCAIPEVPQARHGVAVGIASARERNRLARHWAARSEAETRRGCRVGFGVICDRCRRPAGGRPVGLERVSVTRTCPASA